MQSAQAAAAYSHEDVTYACEYCRTKYLSYVEAEACELACQQKQGGGPPLPALTNGHSAQPAMPAAGNWTPQGTHPVNQPAMQGAIPGLPPGLPFPGKGGPPDVMGLMASPSAPPVAPPLPLPPEILAKGIPGVPPEVLAGKGPLIAKGIAILAAKGVLPGIGGKGGAPSLPGKAPELSGSAIPAPTPGPAASGLFPFGGHLLPLPGELAPLDGSGLSASSASSDPFLKEVRSFMNRWEIERRFEPKLISYLKRKDINVKDELERLDRELTEAGVPPVCRTGYLLVVFGEVSEKSTDDDFRFLLTGKRESDGADREDSPENEQPVRAPPGGGAAGSTAAANAGKGGGDRGDRGSSGGSTSSVPPLPEAWMQDEVDGVCSKFKLDDAVKARFTNAMRNRKATFKEDIRTLNDVLRAAKHPKGALSLKLRENENGTFQARTFSPLGPTPAEKQDMERAAAERAKGGDKEREKSRDRRSRDRRRRSRSRSRRRERE